MRKLLAIERRISFSSAPADSAVGLCGGLRAAGLEPLAFSDNRRDLWGTEVDGLAVYSPEDAAHAFGSSAAFVVTIWGAGSTHRLAHSKQQLQELGCDTVLPPAWLYWHYPQQLLPFYALDLPSQLLEDASSIRQCFELWSDEASQREFVRQIYWRLNGDPECLAHPDPGEQYLVADVAKERTEEVVLDCGAYDGDTLRAWLAVRGPTFRTYFAMEPDPLSRERLKDSLDALDPATAARVRVLPYSVSNYTGTTTFSASGSLSSAIGDESGITVQCIRLDDLEPEFEGEVPTFLKMDVEGAELDALAGGRSWLQRTHPMFAIATYHRQDHLWRVPLAVNDIWTEYDFYLRPHNEEGWDLILYAVPPNRSLIH